MYRIWTLLQLLAVWVVLGAVLSAPSAWAATSAVSNWLAAFEVSQVMGLPDGNHVSLRLEDIIKIKSDLGYIVITEPFSRKDRLICLTAPSPRLRLGQVVDVEGDLTTLPSGVRALQNVTVCGYASKSGELTYHPSIIKGLPDVETWPWGRIDLTDGPAPDSDSISAAFQSSNEPNTDPADGPTYYARIGGTAGRGGSQPQGIRVQSFYDGIPDLAGLDPGSLVELQCKRITAVGTETIDSTLYHYVDMAEDLPSTDWIRCYYSAGDPATSKRINRITGQIRYTNGGTTEVICVDDGPGYDPQILEGRLDLVSPNTVAFARTQANGASATLTGKVVAANQADFPGVVYLQEPFDSGYFGGIRVTYTGTKQPDRGKLVDVTGTISLASDGERVIAVSGDSNFTVSTDPAQDARPIGMPNKLMGGGNFNVYTPGVSNPAGSGIGVYNKSMLVKIWGKVTAVDAVNKFFYIDDGTGFDDGSGNTGVKVCWDWPDDKASILPPLVDWYVSVAGLSSSDTSDSGATYYRVVRPRD